MRYLGSHSILRIVGSYALFGFIWILTTDRLLTWLLRDPEVINYWQTYKGWLFVGVSTLFIYGHLELAERRSRKAQQERDALLERVQIQAAQMDQVVACMPEGVILLDRGHRIVLANPTAQDILERLGRFDTTQVLTLLGERPITDFFVSPIDGSAHELLWQSEIYQVTVRALDSGPLSAGWLLVIHDATRERAVAAQMQQQERLAAIGQMAAGIAHDFNNILSIIVMYAGAMMHHHDLDVRMRERLGIIHEQALRAAQMISQILDFSRSSAMHIHPLDLLSLVKEQKQLLERILPEHIEVQLISTPGDYIVDADLTRITQVLMNLAVNARDAMPQGGVLTLRISHILLGETTDRPVKGMKSGYWVRLEVADTGTGIDPTTLTHIFEPFFTTKATGAGTGLGLAQVHGIVQQHGGHIAVTSKEGEGSSFVLYFPALHAQDSDKSFAIGAPAMPQGRGERILLVEDDDSLRNAIADLLRQWGYSSEVARNGEEALTVLAQTEEPFNLLISDVIMPKLGGVALYHTVSRQFPDLPMILITGYTQNEEIEELIATGLHGYLTKPLIPHQLAQMVDEVLRRRAEVGD